MHSLACSLRPVPNGALTPPSGPGAPRPDRFDPFGPLTETWQEHFPFSFVTAATSDETHVSRVIHGPFIVTNLTSNSQAAVAELNSLAIFISDDDGTPTSQLVPRNSLFQPISTDTTDQAGAFPSQTSYLAVPLGYIHRGGTARIILTYHNGNAATRALMAVVSIMHLRRAEPGEINWRY